MPDPSVVYVQNKDGSIGRMSREEFAANPQNFLAQGMVPIDPAHVNEAIAARRQQKLEASQQKIAEAEAGTLGGMGKTAASAVASGAVDAFTSPARLATALGSHIAGTEDPLEGMTGRGALETGASALAGGGIEGVHAARDFAKAERTRAQVNPNVALGGSIVGQVVGAGGLGGLARGAGGIATKTLGGGLLARAAGSGLAMGIEGGALGLTQAQDQAYIENRKLTGEQAIAAIGMGSLLGAGLGAGGKLAGEGLGAVFGYAKNKAAQLAERAGISGEAAADGKAVQKILRTTDADLNRTVQATTGETALPQTAQYVREGVSGKSLAEIKAAEQDAASRALRANINEMEVATKNLSPEWRQAKAENVAKVIAKGDEAFAAQSAAATDQLGAIRERVDAMLADDVAYGERASLSKLSKRLELAERKVSTAIESGQGEHVFEALDTLKRDMGPLARRQGLVSSDRATSEEMRSLYEGLRQNLMDGSTWGGAADMQKSVNAAYEKWLGTKNLFDRRFLTETGREGWERTVGADPGKIEPYVAGLGKSRNDLTHGIIEQHIESTKELAEALANAGELTKDKAAELASVRRAAESFQNTIGEVKAKVGAVGQAETFLAKSREGHGLLGGAAVGHFIGGPLGTAVGLATGAATNPAKFAVQRLAIEQMAGKAEKVIGQSLDGVFERIRSAATATGEAARKLPTGTAKPVITALELFQGKHPTPELAYQKRLEELQQANANYGQAIRNGAQAVFGTLADSDPHAVTAAVTASTKGVQALLSALPVGTINTKSLTPNASAPKPSRLAIQQFADVWAAVMKPMDVLAQIPYGTVTVQQMRAIRVTSPALASWMRDQTIARLSKLDADGVEVPERAVDTLDLLLDLGDAAGPTRTTAFAAQYSPMMGDAFHKASQPKPPKPSSNGTVGSRMKTGTTTMLGGAP